MCFAGAADDAAGDAAGCGQAGAAADACRSGGLVFANAVADNWALPQDAFSRARLVDNRAMPQDAVKRAQLSDATSAADVLHGCG